MKGIRRKTALILITVMMFQVILITGYTGTVTALDSKAKSRIEKLNRRIAEYNYRAKVYRNSENSNKKRITTLKEISTGLPEGQLKVDVMEKIEHLRKKIKGFHERSKMYLRAVKRLKKKIRKIIAQKSAKVMAGKASWYGGGIREYSMCAAMRGYRGHKVKVTNTANGKSVVVVINDYGPADWTGRVIDLSKASFAKLGSLSSGVLGNVKLEVY